MKPRGFLPFLGVVLVLTTDLCCFNSYQCGYCTAPASLQDCAWADWGPGRFATAAHWFTRIPSFKSSQNTPIFWVYCMSCNNFTCHTGQFDEINEKKMPNSFLWREWWQTDPSGGLLTHGTECLASVQIGFETHPHEHCKHTNATFKTGWSLVGASANLKKKHKIPSATATSIHGTGWA